MSVYCAEKANYLTAALDSLAANTRKPDEIIMVLDGPPTADLKLVLENFCTILPIKTIPLEKCTGLGFALSIGLKACSNDWVARFDSDDICTSDRFQKQLEYIKNNPDIDAFSTPLVEFTDHPGEVSVRHKKAPLQHNDILYYARWRNPLNHPSVMFRRSVALHAGNYKNEKFFEDYSLWIRMLQNGARLGNMEHPLVFARAGKAMQLRRGGVRYAMCEISMLNKMRSSGFISIREFFISVLVKTPIRLLSASLRDKFYDAALRS